MNLKNCPFCGGEPMLCSKTVGMTFAQSFSVVCTGCGVEVDERQEPDQNFCFDKAKAINKVIEKWNRRA